MLHLGPIDVAAKGGAGIYSDSNPGIALVLDVSLDVNIFEIIKIKASGKLQINTTGTCTGPWPASPCRQQLPAGSQRLGHVPRSPEDGGRLHDRGGRRPGGGRVVCGLSTPAWTFFGIANMSASGWFNSKGHFDITLDGGLTLGSSSFGLVASFRFNVGFGERQVAGEPEGITEYYFHVGASGSAKLRAFGITFAWVSIGFDVTAAGSGRVPVTVSARASVKILFVKIKVSMSFNLGYIELPKIVYLAGNANGDNRLWSAAEGDGVLVLNTGAEIPSAASPRAQRTSSTPSSTWAAMPPAKP